MQTNQDQFDRLQASIDSVAARIDSVAARVESVATLVTNLADSFSRELHEFREETRSGFARIEETTRRHSTAITAGTFSIGGLTKAVERIEAMIHDRDEQITELRDRVRNLERQRPT